jgi:hypothetical protein
MAEITYTTEQTRTANRARLLTLAISREVGPNGALTGNLSVRGVAQVGYHDGSSFVEHERVPFIQTMTLTEAAAHFGGAALLGFERDVLELMQAAGKLPGGSIA